MVNYDSSGTLWVTSLVEDDVITVTVRNTTTSLDKGFPTEVLCGSARHKITATLKVP